MTAPDNLRELLELAAKAAGWHGQVQFSADGSWAVFAFGMGGVQGFQRSWADPANDDGDSRRLQVACNMCVTNWREGVGPGDVWAGARVPPGDGFNMVELYADHGGDKAKATRWAVLRAAAEMGRRML